jgi:hypothetical protein
LQSLLWRRAFLGRGFLTLARVLRLGKIRNGFSQTQDSPVVVDHNRELDAREKVTVFWERLFKELMAIVDEMIKCHKSKGKRELLNLQSSVNYGDFNVSSRCRKGKAQLL